MAQNGFMDEIRKIPPVTRFLCGSTLAVTLPVMLELVSPYRVLFVRDFVTKRWEIWRVWSSFFLGSSGINFIFDIAMLYRNSDALESGHFAGRSADYAWQLLLAAVGILALNLPLQSFVHTRALLLCLTYVSSALAPPGSQTSIFGLVTVPVKYFPYQRRHGSADGRHEGRRAAHNMEILSRFAWEGEELPPYDDMWFALRICCTRLRYIGATFGSILPSPKSHLFDFTDLHGFSLTFKRGFYWNQIDFNRDELIPGYHRLWDMLIKRCPNLQELALDTDPPTEPVDAQRLSRGRWPKLRELLLGNVVLDWHTTVNPATKRPFITFLEEHKSMEKLHLVGHEPSVAAPDLLSAVHPDALANVEEFSGSLEQIQAFQHKAHLKTVCLPDPILVREGTPLTVSSVLGTLSSLTSLTISFGMEHGYDNGGMLRALVSSCPKLQHLDLTYSCKPSFSLVRTSLHGHSHVILTPDTRYVQDNFARTIRGLCRLRTLHLRVVRYPTDHSLPIAGLHIALINPRLQRFTLSFLARTTEHPTRVPPPTVLESASFELAVDEHGLPASLRVVERRRWGIGFISVGAMRAKRYTMQLRADGEQRKGSWIRLFVERSPAGEDARLILCCVVLLGLAMASFSVFPEGGLRRL
ncbi:hypothetical protein EWM64_g3037 [Hericium alpestre]|uniref:Derlin n=1 Tax=Hericium alpestre TaxID=135208 RepID=A0A4Z0A4Y0_9AGAM|nr:hypothetical protein EWM64_g3037 [Hericium alpestre]